MSELEEAINRIVNDTTEIIVNPDTFRKMVELGLPVSYAELVSIEKYISKLFDARKREALEITQHLPNRFNFILSSVNTLYDEIYECIIFGLNGAAITLCGILVEFTLKQAIYFYENGYSFTYNGELWDGFEKLTLGSVIDRAKKVSLIDGQLEEKLKKFKDDIRNPYNHYNIKKITKDVVAKNVKVVNIETLKQETKDIEAKDNPMIHAQAKRYVDKILVYHIFKFADRIVKFLLSDLEEKSEKKQ